MLDASKVISEEELDDLINILEEATAEEAEAEGSDLAAVYSMIDEEDDEVLKTEFPLIWALKLVQEWQDFLFTRPKREALEDLKAKQETTPIGFNLHPKQQLTLPLGTVLSEALDKESVKIVKAEAAPADDRFAMLSQHIKKDPEVTFNTPGSCRKCNLPWNQCNCYNQQTYKMR